MSSGGIGVWQFTIILFIILVPLPIFRGIARRAGFSGWWAATMLIPFVNIVIIWAFSFTRWPVEEQGQLVINRISPKWYIGWIVFFVILFAVIGMSVRREQSALYGVSLEQAPNSGEIDGEYLGRRVEGSKVDSYDATGKLVRSEFEYKDSMRTSKFADGITGTIVVRIMSVSEEGYVLAKGEMSFEPLSFHQMMKLLVDQGVATQDNKDLWSEGNNSSLAGVGYSISYVIHEASYRSPIDFASFTGKLLVATMRLFGAYHYATKLSAAIQYTEQQHQKNWRGIIHNI